MAFCRYSIRRLKNYSRWPQLLNIIRNQQQCHISKPRWLSCTAHLKYQSFDVVSALSHVCPDHEKLYELSLNEPEKFWGPIAKSKIKWMEDFHTVTNSDIAKGKHEWFTGGKLNISGDYISFMFA